MSDVSRVAELEAENARLRDALRAAEVDMARLRDERDSVVVGYGKLLVEHERVRAERDADRAPQTRMATWDVPLPERVAELSGNGNDLVRGGTQDRNWPAFRDELKRRYDASGGARAMVDTSAFWSVEPTPFEPALHPSPETVERVVNAWREAAGRIADGSFKVGGAYAEQLGAPKGCNCTWSVQPTFVGDPVVHRGRGMMPCPVHVDAHDAPEWQRQPSKTPRYVGEFGDIDEPSVGDVEGYGRRG